MEFVERRSRTMAFGIVSRSECDDNVVCPLRLVCDYMGFYKVQVFFVNKERGRFKTEGDAKELIDRLFTPKSSFVVCRGITDFHDNGKDLGYALKDLRKWELPFERVDSKKCELLTKPKNRKRRAGDVLYDVCTPCKKLHRYVSEAVKRKGESSSRTVASSKCNWRFLSPKSAKKR